MICGIYYILNTINQKKYVGSSINIKKRWRDHSWHLENNKHKNKHLQSSWNKYGQENFEFIIQEEIKENVLLQREGFWTQKYNTLNRIYGYNKAKIDSETGHYKHSEESKKKMSKALKGRTFSDETKKKMSKAKTEKYLGKGNPFYGKNHTKKTKEKISASRKGKAAGEDNPKAVLTWNDVNTIREERKNENRKELAKEYGVNRSAIDKILRYETWKI